MRVLRSHHITNLVAVLDSFLPRADANPLGGRPIILHTNEKSLYSSCSAALWHRSVP